MKKQIMACAAVFALLSSIPALAQIPASNPDIPITSGNATHARHVSCDMLLHSVGGGQLRAIAYDDHNTYTSTIYLEDYAGGTFSISIANAVDIDIVLGDDMANPGNDFIATVVYNSMGTPFIESFVITGTGSGTLGAFSSGSSPLPSVLGGPCYNAPRIDMYPDPTTPINGIPSLHGFALIWTEYQPFLGSTCFLASGDNGSIGSWGPTYTVTTGTTGDWPDVACLTDMASNEPYAYVASNTGGNVDLWEVNLATTANAVINSGLNAGMPVFKNVRIEAMNQYDPAAGLQKYQLLYAAFAGSPVIDMISFNDLTGNTNLTAGLPFLPGNNMHPAVSAGPGPSLGGGYGNENHSVCWYNDGNPFYYSQAIEAGTGTVNAAFPFHFEVNQQPAPGLDPNLYDAPIAVSSSSNWGDNELLTAWVRDNDIYYKYQGDITQYKPTHVPVTTAAAYKLYPNPAAASVHIEGVNKGTYAITDITGRRLLQGTLTKTDNSISIETLTPGMYITTITENSHTKVLKFTKK